MRTLVIAGLVGLLALPASAAELTKGEKELNFSFSYSDTDIDNGPSIKDTTLEGRWGWMLTDMHEVGVDIQYFKSEIDDPFFGSAETDGTGLGAFYNLNFGTGGDMTPFVGAFIATLGGDQGDIFDTVWGLEGGLKIYPWENGGFLVKATWSQFQGADNFEDADDLGIGAGILVKWGGN